MKGVVVVVLSVLLLGQVVTRSGERDLLRLGLAIGVVILALTYFLGTQSKKDTDKT